MHTIDWLQQIFEWAKIHPYSFGIIVLLLSLSESLAIVGLFVPGVAIMTGVGALIGSKVIPAFYTIAMAAVGAVIGDGLSYLLGRVYSHKVCDFYVLRRYPNLINNCKIFFKRHGAMSVIFGRFVGPVRPVIPVVAGMMDMPAKNFYIANIISAILWAPTYIMPGLFIGASINYMPPGVAKRLAVIVVLVLAALWLVGKIMRFLISIMRNMLSTQSKNLWRYLNNHKYKRLQSLLKNAANEDGQIELLIAICFLWLLFLLFTYSVLQQGFAVGPDGYIHTIAVNLYRNDVAHIMVMISSLFATTTIAMVSAAIASWLIFNKYWDQLLYFVLLFLVGGAILFACKSGLAIARPQDVMEVRNFFSYPSGHVFRTTILWGYVLMLCTISNKNKQVSLISIIVVAIIVLISSISRLYLGAHWLSDIIGAILLAVTLLLTAHFLLCRNKLPTIKKGQLLSIAILFSILGGTINYYRHGNKELHSSVPSQTLIKISLQKWLATPNPELLLMKHGIVGQNVADFNIQWAESKQQIVKILTGLHWLPVPTDSLFNLLFIFQKDPDITSLPVLPTFYNHQLPQISYYREVDPKTLIVLRLWDSLYVVEDKPLWVGVIEHRTLTNYYQLITLLSLSPDWTRQQSINNFYSTVKDQFNIKWKDHTKEEILLY